MSSELNFHTPHFEGCFFMIANLGTNSTRIAQSGSHTAIGGIWRIAWEYLGRAIKPAACIKASAR